MNLHLYIPSWAVVILGGLIAGLIAMALVPGKTQGGYLASTVVGVIGGIIGRMLMPVVGLSGHSGNPLWNLLVAVVGAVVLLVLYNLATSYHGPTDRLRRPR